MINYLLLVGVVIGISAQSIIQKQYNRYFSTVKDANYLYNFFMSLCAFCFFAVLFVFSPKVNISSLPYALGFAITICMAIVFQVLAIKEGPLALTALAISFSLLIPTFYGIIFCGEKLTCFGIGGIVLLVLSLFLVNEYSKPDKKITKKYITYLILGFLGNGFCSTIQKMHQIKFEGNYGRFFLFMAMFVVMAFNLIVFLTHKSKVNKSLYQRGVLLASLTGICNGAVNYLVVYLTTFLPSCILYPTISAGSTLIVFLIALFIYKERFKKHQYCGYILGIFAIILLNL